MWGERRTHPSPHLSTLPSFADPASLLPVLVSALLLASGCGRGGEPSGGAAAPKPATPVQVKKAEKRNLTRVGLYVGSMEPVRVARMASPAEGPVIECVVREGDKVLGGQQLVRVGRSHMAEASLEAAREELKRQEADFQRVEQLVNSGSLPQEQLDIARASLKRAQAQVAAAETAAGDYDIRAPWDGLVSKVWVAEGNYVAPRAPLVDLYDPASLRVRFAVPEGDVRRMAVGQTVRVRLDAWPGRVFEAVIERIYPQLDPVTRTLTVEAEISADVSLLSGLFARVEAPLETAADAVVIPGGALQSLPSGDTIVYVVQDEKVARRKVKTGLEAGEFVQVLEGVQPGEDVVVRGQEGLKDGAPVKVMGKKPEGGPGQGPAAEGGKAAKP